MSKRLLITTHAADRFIQYFNRGLSKNQAIDELYSIMAMSKRIKPVSTRGDEVYLYRSSKRAKPARLGLLVEERESYLLLKTILPGHSHKGNQNG